MYVRIRLLARWSTSESTLFFLMGYTVRSMNLDAMYLPFENYLVLKKA